MSDDDVDRLAESAYMRAFGEGLPDHSCRLSAYAAVEDAVREQIAALIGDRAESEARRCYLGGNSQETDGQRHAASIFEFGMRTAARLARGES